MERTQDSSEHGCAGCGANGCARSRLAGRDRELGLDRNSSGNEENQPWVLARCRASTGCSSVNRPTDGQHGFKAATRALPDVIVQPGFEHLFSVFRGEIDLGAGAFAQSGLDEEFGLSVGFWEFRAQCGCA